MGAVVWSIILDWGWERGGGGGGGGIYLLAQDFDCVAIFLPLGWKILKLDVTHIWLLDFFGPASTVSVDDYFKVKL